MSKVLLFLFLLVGVHRAEAQTVFVDGTVLLGNQTQHAGVTIEFEPLSPSSRAATLTSNADGTWFKTDVNIGIYNIRFRRQGFVSSFISNVFISRDTTFAPVTLRAGGTTEIQGSQFGVRAGNTITLSGDTLYYVRGDLSVANRTLIIEGGAELRFDRGTGLFLTNSTLDIRGTARDSVLFSSGAAIPNFGDWKGVTVTGGSNHRIHGVTFEYGEMALHLSNTTGVEVRRMRSDKPQLNRFPVIFDQITGLDVRESWFTANNRPVLDIRRVSGIQIEENTFVGGANQLQIVGAQQGARIERNRFVNYTRKAIAGQFESWFYNLPDFNWGNSGDFNIKENEFSTINETDVTINIRNTLVVIENNIININPSYSPSRHEGTGLFSGTRTIIKNNTFLLRSYIWIASGQLFNIDGYAIIENNDININAHGGIDSYHLMTVIGNGSRISDNKIRMYSNRRVQFFRFLELINIDLFEGNSFLFFHRGDEIGFEDSNNYIANTKAILNNEFVFYGENNSLMNDLRLSFSNVNNNKTTINGNIFYSNHSRGGASILMFRDADFLNNIVAGTFRIINESSSSGSLLSNNVIFSNNSERGLVIREGSQLNIENNTIINFSSNSSVGIEILGNSKPVVYNNHIEGYNTAINASSGPVSIGYNNFRNNNRIIQGGFSPAFLGLLNTYNQNGTPSDVYYNISQDPEFASVITNSLFENVSVETFEETVLPLLTRGSTPFYRLLPTSPLINAGSDRFTDPDGTRSDIGAFPFDFGNPKRLRLVESMEGGFTVAFDPVERDSVIAYRVYGAVQGQNMAFLQTVSRGDTTFTLTNLINNTPFAVQMTTSYPNSESIRSVTGVFRAGVPRLAILTPRVVAQMRADTLKVEEIVLKNTGTQTLNVYLDLRGDTLFSRVNSLFDGPFNVLGKTVYISKNYSTWFDAVRVSRSYGLDLLSIVDSTLNERIGQLFHVSQMSSEYWIGGYISSEMCDFAWVDGSDWEYNHFHLRDNTFCRSDPMHKYLSLYVGSNRGWGGGWVPDVRWHLNLETQTLPFLAAQNRVPHRLSQSRISIEPGQTVTVRDTLISRFNQHLSSHLLVRSNDPLAPVDSIFFALVRGVEAGLSPVYFAAGPAGGASHVVVVEDAAVDGTDMVAGDEVALYSSGRLVASASFNGTFPLMMEARGFTPGDTLLARLYRAETGELVDVRPTVRRAMRTFTETGYSAVSLQGTQRVPNTLTLPGNRFSMISTFVDLPDRTFASHFSGIGASIVQDDDGRVWIPAYNINTLGPWNTTRGYALYRAGEGPVEVTLTGKPVVPAQHPIPLSRNRFSLLPSLYGYPVPVNEALADLASGLSIVQDDEGQAWIPALNLNTLGTLRPGKGYQMFYTGTATSFTFPSIAPSQQTTELPAMRVMATSHYGSAVQRTGLPWNVIVSAWPTTIPNEVELSLWDGDLLVGAAQRAAGHTLVTAWRGDAGLELAGFRAGHPVLARYWNPATQTEHDIQLVHPETRQPLLFGEGAYALAIVEGGQPTSAEADLPVSISLDGIFPNPFQRVATVHFSLPEPADVSIKVYNLLGQQVLSLGDGAYGAGRHRVEWDAQRLASGVYVVHFTSQGYSAFQRMTLVK